MGPDAMILVYWMLNFSQLFHSPLSPSLRGSLVPLCFHFLSFEWYHLHILRLLIFVQAVLIPVGASSSPGFHMMCSAYKLNKLDNNILPWYTPFLNFKQFVVPCTGLTVASWPAYRFLKRQVRWSGIPISFRIFHSLLWSTQSKALA